MLSATVVAQIPKPTDAPNPLSPEQSVAAFHLPDGFQMNVVASEPLIASPTAVCWDGRGRMFVAELHGYNLEGQLDIEELNKTGKLSHPDSMVRIHALQLAERWLPKSESKSDASVLDAVVIAADREQDSHVLLQIALSIGESREARAFALLEHLAQQHRSWS